MTCYGCPDRVPVVSAPLAERLLRWVPPWYRKAAVQAAADWLLAPVAGVTCYEGLGRTQDYREEEKRAVALEAAVVASLPCPFWQERPGGGRCLLGGLNWHPNHDRDREPYAWLPVWVLKRWAPKEWAAWTQDRLLADAKTAGLARNTEIDIRKSIIRI